MSEDRFTSDDTRTDEPGLGRVLFFGDAVVAIAITLLALPLVDSAISARSAAQFLADQSFELIAASISFVSIAGSWRTSHAVFRRARGYTPLVMNVQFLWLASIVALPIATALVVIDRSSDRLALAIYLGVITVSPLLTQIQREILIRGGMLDRVAETRLERLDEWLPIGLRLVAIALTVIFPQLGLWSLLVLGIGRVVSYAARLRRAL